VYRRSAGLRGRQAQRSRRLGMELRPPGFATVWSVAKWADREVFRLDAGAFALVMATGILSNAFFADGHRQLSDVLLVVNLAAYSTLCLLMIWRIGRFKLALGADLIDPRRVFSFFTIVAGTDVLGVGIDPRGYSVVANSMWLFALVVWLALNYLSFSVLTVFNTVQRANIVHGGWLIAIVGTQSLVVLGAHIAPTMEDVGPAIFVLLHALWGIGLVLYGMFITLFAQRIFLFELKARDVTPLLWVVMGAAAISANAGSTLILYPSRLPFLESMRPFMASVTLILWAWATWLIPLLLLLGIWKHGVSRIPVSYTPLYWSLVFPLGMYVLASVQLSLAADFPPLRSLSHVIIWIALAAWAATGAAFILTTSRSLRNFVHSSAMRRRTNS
jgi:tellurite resistance protein TehA-like permease